MKRLAIITTHPIQYHAPLFRLVSERKNIALKVFYTWGQSKEKVYDARFGTERSWDIPLLDGYDYEFIPNIAKHPDSNRFWGVINPGLIKQLKYEKFDAILVFRWNLWSHLKIMQSFGGETKLFFRGDSQWIEPGNYFKSLVKKMILKFVYRKVDAAFVVGRLNRQYFLKCGFTEQQLPLALHSVDNNRFQQDYTAYEERANIERERLSIPMTAVVFVYAGKFYSIKQLPILIQAFNQLKGEHFRLVLYGGGKEYQYLKTLAADDARIIFQPFKNQSEMPVVYRVGDVFVLPSLHETWGLSVNEAMACGRPAIVSDRCGCAPELIVDNETGYLFKTGNHEHLLDQLKKFNNRTTAEKMGKKALLHIHQFSMENIAKVIEREVQN